jgi:site-specific recombinase XerD
LLTSKIERNVRQKFRFAFLFKKPKNYRKGEILIYLRITVDGIPREVSVKRNCDPDRWNPDAGRASGTKESIKALNTYLDTSQAKVYDAKRKLIEANQMITSTAIKDILVGNDQRNKMLIKIFEDYNADVKTLIDKDYSESTWTKYDRTKRLIQKFLKWKYKVEDIHIKQLDFEFVFQLDIWFKTVRNCNQNTTTKYVSILKMVVLFCVANKWLNNDPLALFEMKKDEVDPVFLTKNEIEVIANKKIAIERLERVRDVYIFCCFTGLAFADIEKLKRTEIAIGIDNELWIFTNRFKTEIKSRIPLLPVTLQILEKYKNDPQCANSDKALPVLSNQKYNSYLKELADICGIDKKLTTHTARHTFGTSVTLSNGVPIESVSKMLGHKKISTTQHYARVLDIKVSEDMQKLKDRLRSA